jgi:hypothetical protein
MALAVLLEGLQAFTPDRPDFYAALISASGAMAAIVPADFLIRGPKRPISRALAAQSGVRRHLFEGTGIATPVRARL